jgi:hypothetical protein
LVSESDLDRLIGNKLPGGLVESGSGRSVVPRGGVPSRPVRGYTGFARVSANAGSDGSVDRWCCWSGDVPR